MEKKSESLIVICAWHKPKKLWWDGSQWRNPPYPPGEQTHTLCPECYDKEMAKLHATKRYESHGISRLENI